MKSLSHIVILLSLALNHGCSNAPKQQGSTDFMKAENDRKLSNVHLEQDAEFLVGAANGSLYEVELGKLTQTNGLFQGVKDFGKMMNEDHSKLTAQLKKLALAKDISIPATISDDKHARVEYFSGLKGRAFDEVYIQEMLLDHQNDVKVFEEKMNDEESDADLRRWAKETLPILKSHLFEIESIDNTFNHRIGRR